MRQRQRILRAGGMVAALSLMAGAPSVPAQVQGPLGGAGCRIAIEDAGPERPHLRDPDGDAPVLDVTKAWIAREELTGAPQATIEVASLPPAGSDGFERSLRLSWTLRDDPAQTRFYVAARLTRLGEEFTYGRLQPTPAGLETPTRDGDTTGLVFRGSPARVVIDIPLPRLGDPGPGDVLAGLRAEGAVGVVASELAPLVSDDTASAVGVVASQLPPLVSDDTANATVACDAVVSEGQVIDRSVATTVYDASRFLYTGPNPIQRDVDPQAIQPQRAAVVRGRVLDPDGVPVEGVRVSLPGHPELGWTASRADGAVDMAVNGGGVLRVRFEADGFLPVERKVATAWGDYAALPDVALTPLDRRVTEVSLGPDSPPQLHRATAVADADGQRQATLIVPSATQASLLMPDGTRRAVERLHLRATEYTVGEQGQKAMPAELPPTSGYTYAVELSADEAMEAGASGVEFSKPLPFYVENFLGFPVGSPVPAGFYDRAKAAWVASQDGRVIKILGRQDDLALLDVDGSGNPASPDQLAALGITDEERRQLATLYPDGRQLWRVPVSHFTPWDFNWPYGPPPGAGAPDNPPPRADDQTPPCTGSGSIIECQNQVLGEEIPVSGTPFALHYRSSRTPGRKSQRVVWIPLTGASPPAPLRRVDLEVVVAGRVIRRSFAPAPNLATQVVWDGLDAYGRPVQGAQLAWVRIGYVYQAQYYAARGDFERSFALPGRTSGGRMVIARDGARFEITLWEEWGTTLGSFDARGLGLGGWTLSPHHAYSPVWRTVYLGTGELGARKALSLDAVIQTAVGGGVGDGAPATQAFLAAPSGVTVGGDGSLYIADTNKERIRRVGPDGIITTVAGNGTHGFCGDGGPATGACLNSPSGVAVGGDGSLYIADSGNNRIRRVGPDGIITTVAGNGTYGFCGDGGPATQACLRSPSGVAVGGDGSLYIADIYNYRIRRVGPDGIITTVAGNGTYGFCGDGGPATQACLNAPSGVAVGGDGSLYIADTYNYRIRRVGPDGIITTVAGNGTYGFCGDGGPATQACLSYPSGVAVGGDGSLYIADTYNHRIRRVGPDGIITTVAGSRSGGQFCGDGGPATQACLSYPSGVAVGGDGSLYIADTFNQRIRRVRPDGIITTVAGNGIAGFCGDGGPATGACLNSPYGVAVGGDGSLYIADSGNNRIRRVRPDGIITTVVGNWTGGIAGFCGDGGPATQACLSGPYGVAVGGDGSLYIADFGNNRIRRVGPDGIITTVAGKGTRAFCGDGGPATGACLYSPRGVAVGGDGSLYIADTYNHRIRRVGPDGIITTVAGNGTHGFCGDGGPATQACLNYPSGVAVGGDGSLYIADIYNYRIRRVGPDGIITTVAGNGTYGFCGDGGPATQACLSPPLGVAVGGDGSLYIADTFNQRIRRVVPDGIITTVAGSGTAGFCGDGGPATGACLNSPYGVAVGGDGSLYIADSGNNRIRRVASPFPGFSGADIAIPSENGAELYHFSPAGRHLRTLSTLTGATLYSFGYDASGRLVSITDAYGNVTHIERDRDGRATAIVAPFGQRTSLAVNADGYLTSVRDPGGNAWSFAYTRDGLLVQATNPNGAVSRYAYDEAGRLVRAEDPVGGVQTLSRTDEQRAWAVTLTSPLGRQRTYRVEALTTGELRYTVTDAAGDQTVTTQGAGRDTTVYPDGTRLTRTLEPDPRFGMQSPVVTATTTTPAGGTRTARLSRQASLSDPENPLSLRSLTETFSVNGRTWQATFDAPTRTWTRRSPAGRTQTVVLDAAGSVVEERLPGRDPVRQTYDAFGRLVERQWGTMVWRYSYGDDGLLSVREDPGGAKTTYLHDPAGRLVEIRSPAGRRIRFAYDQASNLVEVTPPLGASHHLTYTPVGLLSSYLPPGGPSDRWSWTPDRQLGTLTRASGRQLSRTYDASGRLASVAGPESWASFAYIDGRRLASATWSANSDQAILAMTYVGSLPRSVELNFGPSAPTYTYSFDYRDDWLPSSVTLAGRPAWTLDPDPDGLPAAAGPFTITRDAAGQPTVLSDAQSRTEFTYDSLGRLTSQRHLVAGVQQLRVDYTYDAASRLASRQEVSAEGTSSITYAYDPDGRLVEVARDGTVVERYEYDPNGNRTVREVDGVHEEASFDSADHLLSQGTLLYTSDADGFVVRRGDLQLAYSARGELLSATLADGRQVTYAYDAFGRLISRTSPGGAVTRFLYALPGALWPAASVDPSGVITEYAYTDDGRLFALRRAGQLYYVASDQVGSPLRVFDSNGNVVKAVSYEAYGALRSDSNPAFALPIGFAGGIADPDTGLVRFGLRDYDPISGRWLGRDPALFEGRQANLYAYAGDDPVNFRDPLGLFNACLSGSILIGIGVTGEMCAGDAGFSFCLGVGVGAGLSYGGSAGTGSVPGNKWYCRGKGTLGPCSISVEIGQEEMRPGGPMCWKGSFGPKCGPVKGSLGYTEGQGFSASVGRAVGMGGMGAEASLTCGVCASTKGYL